MKVKTFHALTMQDAMRAIKEELGPDAIILSSKEVREGGRLLRAFNRPVLEVMAASDQEVVPLAPQEPGTKSGVATPLVPTAEPSSMAQPSAVAQQGFQQTLQSFLTSVQDHVTVASAEASPAQRVSATTGWKSGRVRQLCEELGQLTRLLGNALPEERQSTSNHVPPMFANMARSLVRQGFRPSTAEWLLRDVQLAIGHEGQGDESTLRHALGKALAQRIQTAGPLLRGKKDRAVGLLLGPSGVGKTSVAAKLAAYYRLEQRRSVVLITLDAYREAAIEQLRSYARVIGAPFATGVSARQVHEGLRRHAQADLILIDMPGNGLDEMAAVKELHHLFEGEKMITTYLVLHASTREQELSRIIERAGELPQVRLLFTKLDESESFGTMCEVAHQTGVPLAYWGTGRRVPEDLEVASSERLAEFLLAQRYVSPHLSSLPSCRTTETVSVMHSARSGIV